MYLCSDRESFKTAVFDFDVCALLYCLSLPRAIDIFTEAGESTLRVELRAVNHRGTEDTEGAQRFQVSVQSLSPLCLCG
jgi:hypothetical protein